MNPLADKVLIMVVGPSSIGKSTLMNKACRIDPEFARVKSFTTRPVRSNDETNQYFYLTNDELDKRRADKLILSETVFPTTGYHYGTIAESYRNTYNLLDTLANSVEQYRAMPFASTHVVSVTASREDWTAWFRSRYPHVTAESIQRLQEAKLSIEWSLDQSDSHSWVVNSRSGLAAGAAELIRIGRNGPDGVSSDRQQVATALLQTVNDLLSYQQKEHHG